jgi:hypothetical protein
MRMAWLPIINEIDEKVPVIRHLFAILTVKIQVEVCAMIWNQPAIHIDFIKRSHLQEAEPPVGYWFLTKICGEGKVEIWRKTDRGDWLLEAPKTAGDDDFTDSFGSVPIHKRNGLIFASGNLERHLERLLQFYKKRNGFSAPQYEYWKNGRTLRPPKKNPVVTGG